MGINVMKHSTQSVLAIPANKYPQRKFTPRKKKHYSDQCKGNHSNVSIHRIINWVATSLSYQGKRTALTRKCSSSSFLYGSRLFVIPKLSPVEAQSADRRWMVSKGNKEFQLDKNQFFICNSCHLKQVNVSSNFHNATSINFILRYPLIRSMDGVLL